MSQLVCELSTLDLSRGNVSTLARGNVFDDTYMWVDGLGDDWMLYGDVKSLLPTLEECKRVREIDLQAEAMETAKKQARYGPS